MVSFGIAKGARNFAKRGLMTSATDTSGTCEPDEAAALFQIGRSGALVLDAVRRQGSVARSELTSATHLSQQSVHRLAEDLLARGFLRIAAPRISGRGKPSPTLSLAPEGAYGIGLAIDTDDARLTVTNLVGDILHLETLESDPNRPGSLRKECAGRIPALFEELELPLERVSGMGVSMQGYRRQLGMSFIPPAPISAWRDLDVVEVFQPDYAFPVLAENNGTLGAEAENWVGAGRTFDNFAYLSFNLGFGGGLVIKGEPFLGHHMNAAEISSIYTEEEDRRRPALRTLIEMLQENGHDISSVSMLKRLYDPSWDIIDKWVEKVTPALDQMLRAMTGLVDPAAIVFGGEAPRDLRQRLAKAASPRRTDKEGLPFPGPEILISEIQTDPNVLGAALLPIRSRLFR